MAFELTASLTSLRNQALEALAPLQARIQSELASSDRLKALMAAAVAVFLIAGLLDLANLAGNLERRNITAKASLESLTAQIENNTWKARREKSQALKSVLEERLWSAQTAGLAQAEFDRWLRERLARHKLESQQQIQVQRSPVSTRDPASGPDDPFTNLQRMTAKVVVAPFDPQALLNVLADIAESQKSVVIERLIVRTGRNSRVEMDASTFYRAPGPTQ